MQCSKECLRVVYFLCNGVFVVVENDEVLWRMMQCCKYMMQCDIPSAICSHDEMGEYGYVGGKWGVLYTAVKTDSMRVFSKTNKYIYI